MINGVYVGANVVEVVSVVGASAVSLPAVDPGDEGACVTGNSVVVWGATGDSVAGSTPGAKVVDDKVASIVGDPVVSLLAADPEDEGFCVTGSSVPVGPDTGDSVAGSATGAEMVGADTGDSVVAPTIGAEFVGTDTGESVVGSTTGAEVIGAGKGGSVGSTTGAKVVGGLTGGVVGGATGGSVGGLTGAFVGGVTGAIVVGLRVGLSVGAGIVGLGTGALVAAAVVGGILPSTSCIRRPQNALSSSVTASLSVGDAARPLRLPL